MKLHAFLSLATCLSSTRCLVNASTVISVTDEASLRQGVTNAVSDTALDILVDISLQNQVGSGQITISGKTGLIINGAGYTLSGSDQVRCLNIELSSVTINDLIIANGYSPGSSSSTVGDGGSTLLNGAMNGGGVRVYQASASFVRCTIASNRGVGFGGGISIEGYRPATFLKDEVYVGANATFTLCKILDNEVLESYLYTPGQAPCSGNPAMCNPACSSNSATSCSAGGGVYAYFAVLSFTECDISRNVASSTLYGDTGNGMGSGGGFYLTQFAKASLMRCNIVGNNATGTYANPSVEVGGGGFVVGGNQMEATLVLETCFVGRNRADKYGGGILCIKDVEAYNTDFFENTAGSLSGAVHFASGSFGGYGLAFSGNRQIFGSNIQQESDFGGFSAETAQCLSTCGAGEFGENCSTALGASNCFSGCTCSKCPVGTSSAVEFSVSKDDCTTCGPGVIASEGASECTACPVGHFATNSRSDTSGGQLEPVMSGAGYCVSCPEGSVASAASAVVCQQCSGDRYSLAGSSSCTRCRKNFFYSATGACVACGRGTDCSIDGQATQTELTLKRGFWRAHESSTEVLVCPIEHGCAGALLFTEDGDGYCSSGYSGPLCAVCEDRWYLFNGKCNKCQGVNWGQASYATAFVAIVLLVWLVGWHGRWCFGTIPPQTTLHLKTTTKSMFINIQILVFLPKVLDVTFPQPFSDLLDTLEFVTFDISGMVVGLKCFFSATNFYFYLLSVTLVPTAMEFFLLGAACLIPNYRDSLVSGCVLVAFIMCPISAIASCRTLSCQDFDDGSLFLRADYSIDCETSTHRAFEAYSYLMICVWLAGCPLFLAVLIFRRRKALQALEEDRANDTSLSGFRLLFESYKSEFFFWELISLLRRLLLLGVLFAIGQGTVLQLSAAVLISHSSNSLFARYFPFKRKSENLLGFAGEYLVSLVILMAVVQKMRPSIFLDDDGRKTGILLSVFTVLLLAMFGLFAGVDISQAVVLMRAKKLVKIEWAVSFGDEKFLTTLQAVCRNHVAHSNILVYYYTTMETAKQILNCGGIPVFDEMHGIPLSLVGPHDLAADDLPEAVLCCSLPRDLLRPLADSKDWPLHPACISGSPSTHLWMLPKDIIGSLGNFESASSRLEQHNSLAKVPRNALLLPSRCIERVFQLKADELLQPESPTPPLVALSEDRRGNPRGTGGVEVIQVKSCDDFLVKMKRLRAASVINGTHILYHYTEPRNANLIMRGGFRMSTQGQGDGGVYLSTRGPGSYGLGSADFERNMIVDCFGQSRLEEYSGKHKLDLVFVCGMNPSVLQQAPGGRENAKTVSKATFIALENPQGDGEFYLSPSVIMGAFLLDPTALLAGYDAGAIESEAQKDAAVKAALAAQEAERAVHHKALSALADTRRESPHASAVVHLPKSPGSGLKSDLSDLGSAI